jgi:hypothetical protein
MPLAVLRNAQPPPLSNGPGLHATLAGNQKQPTVASDPNDQR